jgi:predicted secreted protein
MSGIRYSLNESDSGKTIVIGKGDVFETNLVWAPGLGFHWVVPVSGCGLELLNDGYYDTGTDFWNTSGHYRARYRAVSPGTSIIDGKFILIHEEEGDLGFNLTVIVK